MAKRSPKAAPEDEAAELYSAPLEEFTVSRDALAKRLRADGDRSEAERVRKLRKPTRPAWAVNRAVRADPKAAERLLKAGKGLERAQSAALGGGGSAELKRAMAAQQDAVEGMMAAVEGALGSERGGAALLDRVRETLRAVAGDEELQAEFRGARIARDREAVGFGGAAPASVAPPAKSERREPSAARRRDAERGLRRATRALDAAAKRAREAGKRVDRAQRALDEVRDKHDDAERDRAEREAEVEAARDALDELRGP